MNAVRDEVRRATARHEFKYVLRPETARRAVAFLRPLLDQDEYCRRTPSGSYTVRSIYFDSPGLESFQAKCAGLQERSKYRIRTYDGPGGAPFFFEIKRKRGLDYFKSRVPLDRQDLEALGNRDLPRFGLRAGRHEAGGRPPHDVRTEWALQRILFNLYRRAYLPVLLVAYEREAYAGATDPTSRVTLDRHLRVRLFPSIDGIHDDDGVAYPVGDWVVLEVKFGRTVPRWMRSLNTLFRLKPQACSKYCTGVAHLLGTSPGAAQGFRHF